MKYIIFILFFSVFLQSCGGGDSSGDSDSSSNNGATQSNPVTTEPKAQFSENVVVQNEINFLKSLTGTSGDTGEIVLDQGQDVPPEWSEGRVIVFPTSESLPSGLAIKIASIEENPDGNIIQYVTPNIDELFSSIDVADTEQISTDQIRAFNAPDNVTMLVSTVPTRSPRSAVSTVQGDELEWLPSLGTLSANVTGKNDDKIEKIEFIFKDAVIVRTKDKQESIKLSASLVLEDVLIHKRLQLQENSLGQADLDAFIAGVQIDYKKTSEMDLSANVGLVNLSMAKASGLKNKYACATSGISHKSEYFEISLSGAKWPKSDVCLGALSIQLSPISATFKEGNGGATNIVPSVDLYLIMGMDLKLSVKAAWHYKHVSESKLGAWLDMTKEDKLSYVNNDTEISKNSTVQGAVNGLLTFDAGVAIALNVAGIKPVVARGYIKSKINAETSVNYSNDDKNILCSKGNIEIGLGYSFHVGVSSKFKTVNVPGWLKTEVSVGALYNYEGQSPAFVNEKYDSCKPKTLIYDLVNTPELLKISNVHLRGLSRNPKNIANAQWEIYQAAPFKLLRTLSQDSIELSNFSAGDYVVILTVSDEGGNEVFTQIQVERLPSAPSNIVASAGDQQVTLTWSSSADQHNIYRTTQNFDSIEDVDKFTELSGYSRTEVTSGTQAVVDGLTNGTPYYFVVTAVSNGKESIAVEKAEATPVNLAVSAPSGLAVTAGDQQVTLAWASSASAHNVYRATQSFASVNEVANFNMLSGYTQTALSSGTQINVEGLSNDTTYYFVVTAVEDGKESRPSNEVNAEPVLTQILRGKLNDTGITFGSVSVPPYGNNSDCTGTQIDQQDCANGRDAQAQAGTLSKIGAGNAGFDFTKIDSNGSPLPAEASSWDCVKDNHTGLMWEVKKNANSTLGDSLHDADDRYNWYNTNTQTNGGAEGFDNNNGAICYGYQAGNRGTYCNTQAFVARVNAQGLCGHKDWRLPEREVLYNIMDYSRSAPVIDTDYFPDTQSSFYWTSTPFATSATLGGYAWAVGFSRGDSGLGPLNFARHIVLVRVGQ